MPHTDHDIERAAWRFELLAADLDRSLAGADDTTDLQAVAAAATARTDDARLREAVEAARARGRSWDHIAVALGGSRQAARQKIAPSETQTVEPGQRNRLPDRQPMTALVSKELSVEERRDDSDLTT